MWATRSWPERRSRAHESAASTTISGVEYQTLALQGQQVVTWRNGGHTCVMVGSVPAGELVDLASWGGTGATAY